MFTEMPKELTRFLVENVTLILIFIFFTRKISEFRKNLFYIVIFAFISTSLGFFPEFLVLPASQRNFDLFTKGILAHLAGSASIFACAAIPVFFLRNSKVGRFGQFIAGIIGGAVGLYISIYIMLSLICGLTGSCL